MSDSSMNRLILVLQNRKGKFSTEQVVLRESTIPSHSLL